MAQFSQPNSDQPKPDADVKMGLAQTRPNIEAHQNSSLGTQDRSPEADVKTGLGQARPNTEAHVHRMPAQEPKRAAHQACASQQPTRACHMPIHEAASLINSQKTEDLSDVGQRLKQRAIEDRNNVVLDEAPALKNSAPDLEFRRFSH